MSNNWGISREVEEIVKNRDLRCVYCGQEFSDSRRTKQSWEHIVNDIRIKHIDNVALCCISCNSSKGSKTLESWLDSNYCRKNNINYNTVADVVKRAIKNPPKI